MRNILRALLLLLLSAAAAAIANPGVLITVPFPLSPPTLDLGLPVHISDVVVSNLELTSVQLREADYEWKLYAARAEVNVSRAVISFDWFFKKDAGKGVFTEDGLELVFNWNFTATRENRLEVEITGTKMQAGRMKVELGGGVVETVAVEVTNLILNKASLIFRAFIANRVSSALTDASRVLGQDLQVYHDAAHGKSIKVNTTLVSAPLVNNQTLFLQLNAAPYIDGTASGVLSPPDILLKTNSTRIQLQAHKMVATRVLELIMKIRGEVFVEIVSSDITSVIDIDSLALSPVFPPMGLYPENKDVVFSISVPTVTLDFSGQSFLLKVRGQCSIATQRKSDKVRSLYMNPVNVSASVQLLPLFGAARSSIRIRKLQVTGFSPDRSDVEGGLVVPTMLSQYFPELMEWVTQAGNFQLNRRVLQPAYRNIKVVLQGRALSEHSYNLEVDLQ